MTDSHRALIQLLAQQAVSAYMAQNRQQQDNADQNARPARAASKQ